MRIKPVDIWKPWQGSNWHGKNKSSVIINQWNSNSNVERCNIVAMTIEDYLTQWIMAILSKGCKPDSFESHNLSKAQLNGYWRPLPKFCW